MEKKDSDQNRWNFAQLELRIQLLTFQNLAFHDLVTDAGRVTTSRRNFKISTLQTKNKGPSEKKVFTGKQFEEFKRKKYNSSLDHTTPWNTRPLNTKSILKIFVRVLT